MKSRPVKLIKKKLRDLHSAKLIIRAEIKSVSHCQRMMMFSNVMFLTLKCNWYLWKINELLFVRTFNTFYTNDKFFLFVWNPKHRIHLKAELVSRKNLSKKASYDQSQAIQAYLILSCWYTSFDDVAWHRSWWLQVIRANTGNSPAICWNISLLAWASLPRL